MVFSWNPTQLALGKMKRIGGIALAFAMAAALVTDLQPTPGFEENHSLPPRQLFSTSADRVVSLSNTRDVEAPNAGTPTAVGPESSTSGPMADRVSDRISLVPADLSGVFDEAPVPYRHVSYETGYDADAHLMNDVYGEIDYNDEAGLHYSDADFAIYGDGDGLDPGRDFGLVLDSAPPYIDVEYSIVGDGVADADSKDVNWDDVGTTRPR